MKEIYGIYLCKKCKKETILITDEVEDTIRKGNYLSCSHCGSKKIDKDAAINDLRKCMEHSVYKRVNGAIRQVRT